MSRLRKYALALVMAVAVILSVPVAALAEGEVAQIGDQKYATLDEAIKKAQDGDTIELLADANTDGMNLSKNLTIKAATGLSAKPTVTFNQYGIALWGKSLTFIGCDIEMNGIGSTPYTAEWNWMSICASKDASLTLDNASMTMDATGTANKPHAIYFCSNNKLNVKNGSSLTIKNYANDALEWNGGDGGYNVNITDSTFVSDHNRSGFTGTFYATITNSTVSVVNSTGNGSNGSHFVISNSNVDFSSNESHGLSAGKLIISNSTVSANNNHGVGITVNNEFEVKDNSSVSVSGNADNSGYGYAAVRLYYDYNFLVDGSSSLHICDNNSTGLYVRQGNLTVEDGADLRITGNKVTHNLLGGYGGGLYVGYGDNYDPKVILPANAAIYNNHSLEGGDDLYVSEGEVGPSLTFGRVGTGWALDGEPDCTDPITGWFDDSPEDRWEAHDAESYHAEEFVEFERNGYATVSGPTYLKAAHGIAPIDPDNPELAKWTTSKSKSATNLDSSYESDVTLSLPAAEEELVSDVVFVIDESSCSEAVREDMKKLLGSLYEQIEGTNATIKIGAVQFRGEAMEFPLSELTENTKNDLDAFLSERPSKTGSNMSMGLLAGEDMLDADTSVAADRKYLILVGDGITYVWDDESTEARENYGVNFANADAPNSSMIAGPDGWDVKHGGAYIPNNWGDWLSETKSLLDKTIAEKASNYDRANPTAGKSFVAYSERGDYLSTVDVALYKSYEAYTSIASKYHAYVVVSGVENDMKSFPFGPSFMKFLADGKNVSFDDIQRDIYYLLDAGSNVVDVIGSGTDENGNDYNFDLINDIDRLTLKVGGVEQAKEPIVGTWFSDAHVTAAFGFGSGGEDLVGDHDYAYELYYYAQGQDGNSDECLVWKINVPVSNFAPVQLTYSVRLTNPQTADGTYGTYDADGTHNYDGLYTNNSAVLYPVDSNGEDGVPESFRKPTVSYTVGSVTITPADITIYMGGSDGYESVIESGEETKESNSLPEPGFYITLPGEVNDALSAQLGDGASVSVADLSKYVKIYVKDSPSHAWTLQRYGTESGSVAFEGEDKARFVYRIVPEGTDQDPVRLEFTSESGEHFVSDTFDPASVESLSNSYTMGIYPGEVDANNVAMDITVGSGEGAVKYTRDVKLETGTLNVRYVVGDQNEVVTGVVSTDEQLAQKTEANPDQAFAQVQEGTRYAINGGTVILDTAAGTDASPSLLFDDVVKTISGTGENYEDLLVDKAAAALTEEGVSVSNMQHQAKYLDLVDANNGNVWLQAVDASGDATSVDVCWPYPEGTDESTKFYLVHVEGLHREMGVSELANKVSEADADVIDVYNTENGIRFSTTGFSPFVLVWGASGSTPDPDPEPTPTTGSLKITKQVTGDLASEDDEFTFRITLSGTSAAQGTKTYGGVTFTDGVAEVRLSDGESVTISGLPSGTEYAVEEVDGLDYSLASSSGTSGTIAANSTKTASFVNDRSTPDEPGTPDEPDTPDTPDEPDTPDTPDTPDEPSTPDTPDEPSTPSTPATPSKPSQAAGTSRPEVPDTGDRTNVVLPAALALGGVALVGGALVAARRRSK